jgi:hypothetical protein
MIRHESKWLGRYCGTSSQAETKVTKPSTMYKDAYAKVPKVRKAPLNFFVNFYFRISRGQT